MTKNFTDNISLGVNSLRVFFNTGSTFSYDFRISQLLILKKTIENFEEQLIEALYKDLKKHPFEGYGTELGLIYHEIDYSILNLKKWMRKKKVSSPLFAFPSKSYTLHEPLGVALIIAPWNYPIQLCLLPLVGAIAAGNTVCLKPSEISTHVAEVLETIISSSFDKNFIWLCNGGVETTQALLNNRFDIIFYTGNSNVGKIIATAAAQHLSKVVLELGGKSPCIVHNDADLPLAAKRVVWGKFLNVGQTCIAPDYILIQEKLYNDFHKSCISELEKLYGQYKNSDSYGRIINRHHLLRLKKLLQNVTITYGGDIIENENYFSPTFVKLDAMNRESLIMQEEIFGPILPFITYANIEDAIAFIKSDEKPLALYLFTQNKNLENKILHEISSGGVCINDTIMQIANNHYGFGGVGFSGLGSYHGEKSFATFSHEKHIMKRGNWLDLNIRYSPYTKYSLSFLKRVMRISFWLDRWV